MARCTPCWVLSLSLYPTNEFPYGKLTVSGVFVPPLHLVEQGHSLILVCRFFATDLALSVLGLARLMHRGVLLMFVFVVVVCHSFYIIVDCF